MIESNPRSMNEPDNFCRFAYIEPDTGEIMYIQGVQNGIEHMIAVLRSNPTVVEIEGDLKTQVTNGWSYQNGQFVGPQQ